MQKLCAPQCVVGQVVWCSGLQLVVRGSERLATTGLEHSPCDDRDEIFHVVLGIVGVGGEV